MQQRTVYSIDQTVLNRFNRAVPARKRSALIETLMVQHLAEAESAVARAARLIEADPDYQAVSADADTMAALMLDTMEAYEPR